METQILEQNTCTETRMVKIKFVPYRKWTVFSSEELGRLLGSLPIYRFWAKHKYYFCPSGWFIRLFWLFERCFLRGRHICFENFSPGLWSEFLRNRKSGASVALATDKQTMFSRPASFFYCGNRSKMAASSGYKHGFCTISRQICDILATI